ncbi:thaumatin-like protein 1b [Canna indica]|uniref:Thaumatin-like protein 1b n=1 Tax=Canna indica TaxID=4628 RepID=A0AAQ3QKS4_9LILI|nr:thaumatin-like protein 1b [Canna indica]
MQPLVSLLSLLLFSSSSGVLSTTFSVTNNCGFTIWPGVLSNAGSAPLATTGFALAPGDSRTFDAPVPWSGRIWARTLCSADPATGLFSCTTGDCGSGALECHGGGAAPPATLAEFTLGGAAAGDTDFFDVSLVDGYNLPVLLAPQGGAGADRCLATGCPVDVNGLCPPELRVVGSGGQTVACRSACEAFRTARYCCSGEFGTPNACGPTAYSQLFKNACPRAYSYAYDDATSTFTCPTAATGGYTVTFCPGTASSKTKGNDKNNPEAVNMAPAVNNNAGMVFFGSTANEGRSRSWPPLLSLLWFYLLF